MDTPDIPDFLPTDINPDFHLVISQIDGCWYTCPTRKIDRMYLMGVLHDVLIKLGNADMTHVDPSYSSLNYALSVIRLSNEPTERSDDGDNETADID